MAKIAELKKYLTHEFSTGCYTGDDYKSFQTKIVPQCGFITKKRGVFVNTSQNFWCPRSDLNRYGC